MITMKMNVIDSTESTDTVTFINNEQSITVNILSMSIFLNMYCINFGTKTLDCMEINCSVLNSFF